MAFAPPRRVKANGPDDRLRGGSATRLPVASPVKKRNESIAAGSDSTIAKHESRIIPSRYAQSAEVKSRPAKEPSAIRGKTLSAPGLQSRGRHTAPTYVKGQIAESVSPSKSRQAISSNHIAKAEEDPDEHLTLRLLQIIQTCQEGEKALAEYTLSAKTQLNAKWEILKERRKAHDLVKNAQRVQDTLSELRALSESDVLILENFVNRLEQLEESSLSCSQDFDEWSQDVHKPISAEWQKMHRTQLSVILAIRQSTSSLVYRVLESPSRGNVYHALKALTDYLSNIELELKDLSTLAAQLWENRRNEIEEEFSALVIEQSATNGPFVWDIR